METRTVLRRAISATTVSLVATVAFPSPASPGHLTDDAWLRQTIMAREAALTRAYNTCNLHALRASLFAGTSIETPDGRRVDPVIEARDRICGHLRRQVMPGSLTVRAVGDDSALVTGTQRFCGKDAGSCAVQGSKFAQLWTLDRGHWRLGWMRRFVDSTGIPR
ncbi:MAG: nuclear transport factor 2 family protein [Rhodanobacter sp.]